MVRCVWGFYPVDEMAPGDLYWYNDPYISKGSVTHTPDMVFLAPVFFEGEPVAYCHSFAHFWDLGGSRPGSIGPANTEIFHDGTLVPPIKIVDQGKLNDEAYRVILRNSRYPDLLESDTRALMAAANRAQERLLEIFGRFGKETTLAAFWRRTMPIRQLWSGRKRWRSSHKEVLASGILWTTPVSATVGTPTT